MHKEGWTQCHLSLLEKYAPEEYGNLRFEPPYVCANWVNTATLCVLPRCVFICSVWLWQQASVVSRTTFRRSVYIMEGRGIVPMARAVCV
jgi:hypothetical protein